MMTFIGAAVLASIGAVLAAQIKAKNKVFPSLGSGTLSLTHNSDVLLQTGQKKSVQHSLKALAQQKPVFVEANKALEQFKFVMDARNKSKVAPLSKELRTAIINMSEIIIKKMTDAYNSQTVTESEVNTAIQTHSVLVAISLMKREGIFWEMDGKKFLAAIQKANNVEQGQMSKKFVIILCDAMNFSIQEVMKSYIRGYNNSSMDEYRAMSRRMNAFIKQLEDHTTTRLNF